MSTPISHDDLATEYVSIAVRLDRLLGERECLLVAGVSRHRHVVRIAASIGRALVRIGDAKARDRLEELKKDPEAIVREAASGR